MKSYSELITLPTFEERFQYLKLDGLVGDLTFGYNRYLNQLLYRSSEWRAFRQKVIVRDAGCDLAIPDREIHTRALVHHINPISVEDVINRSPRVFDFDNVITTIQLTHNAIHYGDDDILVSSKPVERFSRDTILW